MSNKTKSRFLRNRTLSRLAALGGTAIIVSSLLMTVVATSASAAGTGAKTGTAIGAVWGTPNNVTTSNDAYATASPANNNSLSQPYGTFNLTTADGAGANRIPPGSIITDITVNIEAKSTDTSGCTLDVQLSGNAGTTLRTQSINLTGADAAYVRNGTWSQVWDPTQMTNGNFRVILKANDPGGNCIDGSTTSVDFFSVTVTYTTINDGTANAALSSTVCDAANFNFIIDMSGSIGEQVINGVTIPSNLTDMKNGILQFVGDFEDNGDGKYSATRFNGNSATALTGGNYVLEAPFVAAINGLSGPNGLTPTGLGIDTGEDNDGNPGPGQQIMFVVTDGSPNVPNTHGDDLTNPDTWLTGANGAINAANAARGQYVVKAFYVSEDGPPADPGDINLPFSNPAGDKQWAEAVMTEIGGGSFLAGDFGSFVEELFKAIHCEPDIRVTKTGNGTIAAGAQAAYTIEVKNIGKGTAHNVELTDDLPAGIVWSEDSPECSIDTGASPDRLNCNFEDMIADEIELIHLTGTTDAADCGPLPNTAHATSSNEPSNVLTNNQDSATITVQCGKITITKDAIPDGPQDFAFTTTGTGLSNFTLDDDADGLYQNTKTFDVGPGAYSITEGAVGGWKLTGLTCNDDNGQWSAATGVASLNIAATEHVTCTYTNTKLGSITVKKLTSPAGAPGSFTFSGDVAGSIGHNGTLTTSNLLPGTYTSTETDPAPPFDLGSISCNDNNSDGVVGTGIATFRLEAGENITCTFTNVQRGSITIIKDAQPDSAQDFGFTTTGSGLSSFSLDDDADGTLSNTQTFSNVKPGAYSVTESGVNGWELTKVDCQGTNGSTGTPNGSTATIDLKAGGSVTCTYTNVQAGRIIVDKVTDPAGDGQSFTFNPSWSTDNFSLTDAAEPHDSGELKPGNYSVVELAQAGWDPTGATCTGGNTPGSIDLEAGETVTCTFNNTKRGHIIVDKVTIPAGDPQEFTFTASYKAQTFKLTDAATPNDSGALVPGTYSVSESAEVGWTQTSATCSDGSAIGAISLQPGETVTCTFTNTKAGHIIVKKETLPDKDPASFEFDPSWSDANFSLTDGTSHDSGILAPATYSVEELAKDGWDLTSATCSDQSPITAISLQAGETITCTFNNTKRGHILVDKVTDPAGDPASFDFTSDYGDGFSLTDGSDPNDSGAIKPGTYKVDESAKDGWDLTGASCDDQSPINAISLQPGETVTCTFTNTKRGSITVEKVTSPAGAVDKFDFSGDVAGSIADGGSLSILDLKPGTYTSTEAAKAGWDLGAIVCDDTNSSGDGMTATFKLDPGEDVTCTFTNVQRGTITIIKDAQPDSAQDFHYDFTGLDGPVAFDLDDDDDSTLSNTMVFDDLVSGAYGVSESAVDGWDLKSLECNPLGGSKAEIDGASAALTLAEGGSITCVYTNSKPSIEIVKTAGDAEDGDEFVSGPGPVTYTYVITNTGTVALQDIEVWDDNGTPETGDDFQADCPATTLAAGASMTCSATVTVTSDRTNTAYVNGVTVKGTPVEDSDWAFVRVPGIGVDKSADDHKVEPNQIVTYTLDVSVSSGPVTDVVVTDTLPDGQTYQAGSASPEEPVITNGGKTLTWTFDELDNGDPTVTITYKVKIDADASTDPQVNHVTVCVSELEECAPGDETVTPEKPGISIVKTAGDAEDGETYQTEPGNVTYTYVVENTGPLPLEDITVTDDNGTPGTGDDFEATCPETTLGVGESMTCTATVAVTVDTINTAVAHGFTAEGNPVEADDDAIVEILVHGLIIDKENNAPLNEDLGIQEALEGATVTYTLDYTFSGDPVSNGVIHDVLPEGITYVADSATDSAEFIFDGYDDGSRTLTWKAATVTASGSLQYKVTVDVGASDIEEQPLVNMATIDSDQTEVDDATSDLFVPAIPEAETSKPTPPQTDVFDGNGGAMGGPGISLLLMLGILGGLVVGLAFITPVPEVVRRRNRR